MNPIIEQRKQDHIAINISQEVNSAITSGLEKYQLLHCALPELNLTDVDAASTFFRKKLAFPILISSMTGGTREAEKINRNLAICAQSFHFSMGIGSQRAGLENQVSMQTFKVRQYAPDILLFANLGAVQLNYSYTVEHCKRAVDAISADALILHLNPLQEALMEEGDTNFKGLLNKIEVVVSEIPVPVVIKEVGWGISLEVAQQLISAGVQAIDVAGAGGSSWSEVEKHRATQEYLKETASAFKDWGIPTADSIVNIRREFNEFPLIASGGLKNGIDIAKCIALGANLGGMARQFLLPAADSEEAVIAFAATITKQFKIAMFAVGAKDIAEFQSNKVFRME
jgi:isopentenyl-diphosphate delta-isomerase